MRLFQRPGSPYWWYDFTYQHSRVRKSSGKLTRRECAIVADDHRHRLRNQTPAEIGEWRLTDALGTYWNDVGKAKASRDSIWKYFESLSDIIGPNKLLSEISNADLMQYRAKRRGRDGVQPQTVNRDLDMLRAALFHARDIYGQNVPSLAWKKVKVAESPHRLRFLSAEEYRSLLAAAHPKLVPIIICAVATGLRRENILEMTWNQIDLENAVITIPRTKSGKPMQVRITGSLRAMLSSMAAKRAATALKAERVPSAREHVFDRTGFRRRWEAAVKNAKLENVRFHDLRHTFASWARIAGADLATIKEAMDHSHVSVTMRYAHINAATHRTAFDAAAEMLGVAQSAAQSKAKRRKNNNKQLD